MKLACYYKDMKYPEIAQPLFALAQNFAVPLGCQIPAIYRTFWAETLLQYSDKTMQDYGIQLILEAAILEDTCEVVKILIDQIQNDNFKNYVRQNFKFDLLKSLQNSLYYWELFYKLKEKINQNRI